MNPMLEASFGTLLAQFRRQSGLNANEVVTQLAEPYISAPVLSGYENDYLIRSRPPLSLLLGFKRALGLDDLAMSYLLRVTDNPPTAEETRDMQLQQNPLLNSLPDGAIVVDYRSQLVCWNNNFANLFDTLPNSSGEGPHKSRTLPGENSETLSLTEGVSFLELIFSGNSHIRHEVETNEWVRFARYIVARFRRTTLPLIRPGWYKDISLDKQGTPPWLDELVERLIMLPGGAGEEFQREWDDATQRLRQKRRNAWVHMISEHMLDTAMYWHGRTKVLVSTQELQDARFTLFRFTPLDGTFITSRV